MNFQIKNKKNIRELAIKNLKSNKVKNLIIIFAIFLTSLLVMVILNIGSSYMSSVQKQKLMIEGMDYDAILAKPNIQQIDILKDHKYIKYAGNQISCASVYKYKDQSVKFIMKWKDDINFKKQTIPALEYYKGNYPQSENEIMLSETSMREMEIKDPKIGMKIHLFYEDYSGKKEKSFILSGYYKDYTEIINPGNATILVSEKFLKTTGYNLNSDSSKIFVSYDSKLLSNEKIANLEKELNLKNGQVFLSETDELKDSIKIFIAIVVLVLLIIISGYLLISNVLSIYLDKDINKFGLYRAIGMTSKQVKYMIFYQLSLLLMIGIILGIIASYYISIKLIPEILISLNSNLLDIEIKMNPFFLLISILIPIVAVYIAGRKIATISTKTSILDAKSKILYFKESSNGLFKGNIFYLALSSVIKRKRRMIMVILSIFIGLTVFMCIETIIQGKDPLEFVEKQMPADIILENLSGAEDEEGKPSQIFDNSLLKALKEVKGIKEINPISSDLILVGFNDEIYSKYLRSFYKKYMRMSYEEDKENLESDPANFYGFLIGINETDFDNINKSIGNIVNKKDFLSGKVGITSLEVSEGAEDMLNKQVSFNYNDKKFEVTIAGSTEENLSSYSGNAPGIYMYNKSYVFSSNDPTIESIRLTFHDKNKVKTNTRIKEMIKDYPKAQIVSRIDILNSMQNNNERLSVFGGVLSISLLFIALMNLCNIMSSSIVSRKKVFAIYRCIGMTKKQLRKLINSELLIYSISGIFLTWTLGMICNYLIFQSTKNQEILNFNVPYFKLVFICFIFLIISMIYTNLFLNKLFKNKSINQMLNNNTF